MGSKGSNTSTSTTSNLTTTAPDAQAQQYYYDLLKRAQGIADTPYQSYTGELTAPVNAQQTAGISGINANAGFAQPYIQDAAAMARSAASPLTAGQIAGYQSPYTQQVVDATQAQFNSQNQQQQQALTSNAIAQGALGGNRTGVAAANLAQAQQTSQAPVIAGLYNQGYQTALQTALSQQQAQAQGAYSLGNLGVAGQQSALSGAGAQVGAGTLQQQTQQAQDQALYNQFLMQQAYPFQTTQWLAGLQTGVGSQLGGTSTSTGTGTQTGPAPNSTGQWLGAGLSAASLIFSDRRLKEDIHKIGETNDGQPIYRYRYKGDPNWHMGLIAQEVEKDHPGAVHGVGGYKAIDLKAATDDAAAKRAVGGVVGFDQGGGIGGTPFAAAQGYVPVIGISAGHGAPQGGSAPGVSGSPGARQAAAADGFSDPASMGKNLGSLGKAAWNGIQDWNNQPLDLSAPGIAAPNGDFGGFGSLGGTGGGLGGFFARGGGVPGFANGGIPFAERYADFDEEPRAAVPMSPDYWLDRSALPAQTAGFGDAAPVATESAPAAPVDAKPGVSVPNLRPGSVAPGLAPTSEIQVRRVSPDAGDLTSDLDRYGYAMGSIESGHRWDAIGPQTRDGDRAYGYYQVMGKNIGPWTKEILGRAMTPQEFLDDKDAQKAVFNSRFGQYLQKTGNPDDAASMWFTGRPLAQGAGASDVTGTTGADYVSRFRNALAGAPGAGQIPGGEPGVSVAGNDQIPDNAQLAQATGKDGFGLLGLISPEVGSALLTAGVGMMASQSPFLGTQIGEGAQRGVKSYTEAVQNNKKLALDTRKVDLDARRLDDAAKRADRQLQLTTRTQMERERHNQSLEDQGRWKVIGTNDDGFPVYQDGRTGEERIGTTRLQQKAPSGYVRNPDGTMSPIKGGPADPATIEARAKAKISAGGLLDDETIGFMAGQYMSGDKSVFQNLGRGAQGAENVVKLRTAVNQKAKEMGLSPDQVATKMADFAGRQAAMRSLGTRGVNVEYAANTANRAIDLAEEALGKVPRTQFVPLNELRQLYDKKTSSPEQAAFYTATNTLVNEYARVAAGGSNQATEGMRQHAREMLNTAMGPEAYRAALNMMRREIQQAKSAYNETRQEFLKDSHNRGDGGEHSGQSGAAPATKPARVIQNGYVYELQPDGQNYKPTGRAP